MQELDFGAALDYIYSLVDARNIPGFVPGLERFAALCERLGNPQDKLQTVHIGGTKRQGIYYCNGIEHPQGSRLSRWDSTIHLMYTTSGSGCS